MRNYTLKSCLISAGHRLTLIFILLVLLKVNSMAGENSVRIIESKLLLDVSARLGEGAFWNHQTNTFWWVDIEGKSFNIYDPATQENTSYPVPHRIGTVVPDQGGNAIVALQDGIYRLILKDGTLELLARPDYDTSRFRFNDGKCDPAGRLWVGTMPTDNTKETAALYRLNHDFTLTRVLEGISISNGIVWTADKKTMYYIDTPTQQVKEYKYNHRTGEIKFTRVAVQIQRELGSPDGMSIDQDGNLWVAHWGGRAVYCWNPRTGDLISKIEVAAKNVTSCAFVGPNLDEMFITSASIGMSDAEKEELPNAGGLFRANPGVKGVRSFFFGKQ